MAPNKPTNANKINLVVRKESVASLIKEQVLSIQFLEKHSELISHMSPEILFPVHKIFVLHWPKLQQPALQSALLMQRMEHINSEDRQC